MKPENETRCSNLPGDKAARKTHTQQNESLRSTPKRFRKGSRQPGGIRRTFDLWLEMQGPRLIGGSK
jgi:hypothetical protein